MPYDIRQILASNLATLMERSADMKSQNALAKRTKVAQTTIGNYLRPESYKGSASLENIDKLEKAFGVECWMMIHPTMGDKEVTAAEIALYQRFRDLLSESKS